MLMKCPECELQVSDKAVTCPHCGYPLKEGVQTTPRRRTRRTKRQRLPNGFGQISEIKGRNLRKPFRAMITVGKDAFGKPVCKLLKPEAYFETYNEAYTALVEYNRNPYDFNVNMTVKELYEKWTEVYFKTLESDSSKRTTKAAWAYCNAVYNIPVQELRARHIKFCMEEGAIIVNGEKKTPSAVTKSRMKSLFNMMLDYAVEYEIIDKNCARAFSIEKEIAKEAKEVTNTHMSFSDDEMAILWENVDKHNYVDMILIQCYSGLRPVEVCQIKLKDIDLKNWVITGGVKTDAGKNRTVPIHTKIRDLIKRRYDQAISIDSKYLFNCIEKEDRTKWIMTYPKYAYRFAIIVSDLGLNPDHKPHDGRKHFITKAKKYKVDEYALKRIVGHEINDVTEKVYTERDPSWLQEEIEKIE